MNNNRSYHVQYRRGAYRKKKIKLIALISAISLVLLLIVFLIVGTILNNKTHLYDPNTPIDSNTENEDNQSALPEAKAVVARGLVLLTQDSSSLYSRVMALPSGTEAVCVRLNDGNTLLYRSEIANTISSFTVAENSSRAENLFSTIQRRELYISAAISMTELSEDSELLRPILLSAYSAMAAEACKAGADDVLLIAPAPRGEVTAEKLASLAEEMISLADETRALAPDACIGFALSDVFLSSESSAEIISKLSEHFNYLAIDATEYGKEDPAEYLERKIGNSENADAQYYLLRYKMRVLLPTVTDSDLQEKLIQIAEQYSSNNHNWQILP